MCLKEGKYQYMIEEDQRCPMHYSKETRHYQYRAIAALYNSLTPLNILTCSISRKQIVSASKAA